MAFYVYALPQPGEVKEKLFILFKFINLSLYHSSLGKCLGTKSLIPFLLPMCLHCFPSYYLTPFDLVPPRVFALKPSLSHQIFGSFPFPRTFLIRYLFPRQQFPHLERLYSLTTQFPNRQSRINFPFPSHLPSQNLIDVTTPEHESIVNLPLPSPP